MNDFFYTLIIVIIIYFFILGYYFNDLLKTDNYISDKNNHLLWDNLVQDCYYINLDRSKERKKYMENILKISDINCKRFEAVDGKNLNICKNLKISKGALGCKLSHLEILKNIKNNNKWTIIFEDDILLDINSKNIILNILNILPNDADIVLFGTSPRMILKNLLLFKFKKYKENIWITDNLSCAHAYAIKYKGAQKWISHIQKNLCTIPFDMHDKGINNIYFVHSFLNIFDLPNTLLKDYSIISQNKNLFGYFDSTINEWKI